MHKKVSKQNWACYMRAHKYSHTHARARAHTHTPTHMHIAHIMKGTCAAEREAKKAGELAAATGVCVCVFVCVCVCVCVCVFRMSNGHYFHRIYIIYHEIMCSHIAARIVRENEDAVGECENDNNIP